jgi:hypothetical protein
MKHDRGLEGGKAMPYTREISRTNPTAMVFLLDQSSSMEDRFAGEEAQSKAAVLALATNRLIQNLVIKATKGADVRDYFHVGVIGYGEEVESILGGPLAGQILVPVSALAVNPLRIEQRVRKVPDGAGGLVEQQIKVPVWIDPKAENGTPMCEGLQLGQSVLKGWLEKHPDCYPPTVIHVTDGEANDGDPAADFAALQALTSSDGPVVVVNIHVSSDPGVRPVLFPSDPSTLPDRYSKLLYEHASPLTPSMIAAATDLKIPISAGAKALVINADPVALIEALDVGTRPGNMR